MGLFPSKDGIQNFDSLAKKKLPIINFFTSLVDTKDAECWRWYFALILDCIFFFLKGDTPPPPPIFLNYVSYIPIISPPIVLD
jgi:hypothetical protein